MTTNADIMEFLKADLEKRKQEKEEDKRVRAQERKEDMEHIIKLIVSGVEKEVDCCENI